MNIKDLIKGEITQDDLLNWYNASLLYDYLPKMVNGFVFLYDNIYFIIINKNLSQLKKIKTILHELAHIELHQLNQSNKDLFEYFIDKYEDEANRYIEEIKDKLHNKGDDG